MDMTQLYLPTEPVEVFTKHCSLEQASAIDVSIELNLQLFPDTFRDSGSASPKRRIILHGVPH
jgi:hypothetical protein